MISVCNNYAEKKKGIYLLFIRLKLLLLCITMTFLNAHAQLNGTSDLPEKSRKKYRLIKADSVYHFENAELDTSGLSGYRSYQKSANFYARLEEISEKTFITRELHNIIIIPPVGSDEKDTLSAIQSVSPFIYDDGKIIRNIYINQIDVFGPEINDTSVNNLSWWQEAGNELHINTAERIIKKNLLFSEGEGIDPYEISDNERLLRDLPFIQDARIFIVNSCGMCDSADILVRTKDVWSIGLDGIVESVNAGRIDIFDRNIFGVGHELQNSIFWDGKQEELIGYEGKFQMRNIGGSFINTQVNYAQVFQNRYYGFNINRRFITDQIKYAGGISAQRLEGLQAVRYLDTVIIASPVERTFTDAWIGRSFDINGGNEFFTSRAQLVLALAYHNRRFDLRPRVDENLNYIFHNRGMVLGSISFVKQNFYRSNLIYSFGRTEDIPYGDKFTVLFGPEFNEFYNRFYLGFSYLKGNYLNENGYLQSEISLGGFVNNESLQQGVFKLRLNYFSNLYVLRAFKFRQFVRFNYVEGINRFENEFIGVNSPSDVTGLTSPVFFGNRKVVSNLETVVFSPYQYLGFRFAFFIGADFGFLGKRNVPIFDSEPFTALNIGVRIRNERLVFKTFQLRFSFYPVAPANSTGRYVDISGEERLNPIDFFVKEPDQIQFR